MDPPTRFFWRGAMDDSSYGEGGWLPSDGINPDRGERFHRQDCCYNSLCWCLLQQDTTSFRVVISTSTLIFLQEALWRNNTQLIGWNLDWSDCRQIVKNIPFSWKFHSCYNQSKWELQKTNLEFFIQKMK